MKAFVTFVVSIVAEEYTFFGMEREFLRVIWTNVREVCTPKTLRKV
jgi:hypothetical protein